MPKYDIEGLKRAIPLPELVERYGVKLQKDGSEYKGLCPFHGENTPSFSVHEGDKGWKFYCFGCGAQGDHVDFVQEYETLPTGEAIAQLASIVGGQPVNDNQPPQQRETNRAEAAPDPWQYDIAPADDHPAPAELRSRRGGEWQSRPVAMAWPYHDSDGNLVAYACRLEWEADGKLHKDVIPICWMHNTETGEARWKQKSLPKPRLLYGIPDLIANPGAQVIICEGEKATDAARRLMSGTGIVVVSWPGGGKAVDHADWSWLAGRKVLGWPDCDSKADKDGATLPYQEQPGMAAMLKIASKLPDDTQFRIVAVPYPGNLADGWDLADAEAENATQASVLDIVKRQVRTPDEIRAMAPFPEPDQDEPPAPEDDDPGPMDCPANDNEPPADYEPPMRNEPFRILGWARSTGFYMPDGFRQVVALKANDHTKLRLLELAPLGWWQQTFPSEKRSGDNVDWALAAESLIRRAQRAGIWDEDMIRGRGAWWDNGHPVVHLGDRVVTGGNEYNLGDAPGRFVYELNTRVDIATQDPLPNADACKLVEICENLRWQRPISGKLLAGWVFLAPICGALEWRPHIWITGGAGSGKSTIMVQIIHRVLKENMLFVQGETSEAGIRQELAHDAVPVVFDEIESQNEKATARVNSIMDLMTISSSETGAKLLKGGANGKAQSYLIRSMFCFSSITVNLKQHAAKTRVTVLDMQPKPINETNDDLQQYNSMLENIFQTLTPEYIRRLQARAVELIPVIRHNARIFAEAAALTVGSRRFGDQVGTLIAGAYALHSQKKITPEAARKWIESQDWDEHDDGAESKDENACLQYLLGQQIRVDSEKGPKTRTIGELVELAAGQGVADDAIPDQIAADTLRRHGLIVEQDAIDADCLIVANSHPMLERLLSRSPWSTSWSRTLARLPRTLKTGVKRFAGAPSRGISIPLDEIL